MLHHTSESLALCRNSPGLVRLPVAPSVYVGRVPLTRRASMRLREPHVSVVRQVAENRHCAIDSLSQRWLSSVVVVTCRCRAPPSPEPAAVRTSRSIPPCALVPNPVRSLRSSGRSSCPPSSSAVCLPSASAAVVVRGYAPRIGGRPPTEPTWRGCVVGQRGAHSSPRRRLVVARTNAAAD
jgi:hypothetical protein